VAGDGRQVGGRVRGSNGWERKGVEGLERGAGVRGVLLHRGTETRGG